MPRQCNNRQHGPVQGSQKPRTPHSALSSAIPVNPTALRNPIVHTALHLAPNQHANASTVFSSFATHLYKAIVDWWTVCSCRRLRLLLLLLLVLLPSACACAASRDLSEETSVTHRKRDRRLLAYPAVICIYERRFQMLSSTYMTECLYKKYGPMITTQKLLWKCCCKRKSKTGKPMLDFLGYDIVTSFISKREPTLSGSRSFVSAKIQDLQDLAFITPSSLLLPDHEDHSIVCTVACGDPCQRERHRRRLEFDRVVYSSSFGCSVDSLPRSL